MTRRVARLNSLLREVISEVITRQIHHGLPKHELFSITTVEITSDLSFAKVYFTMLGSSESKEIMKQALNERAPKIQHLAMKKVVMRIFPRLEFFIDRGLEKQLRIHELLAKLDIPKEDEHDAT